MDHKAFENNMIDYVNRNSKSAEEARREAYLAAKEKENRNRRNRKSDAAVQIVVWVGVYLAFLLSMVYLGLFELVPGEFLAIICAVSGVVTGFKLSALWRAFRK